MYFTHDKSEVEIKYSVKGDTAEKVKITEPVFLTTTFNLLSMYMNVCVCIRMCIDTDTYLYTNRERKELNWKQIG